MKSLGHAASVTLATVWLLTPLHANSQDTAPMVTNAWVKSTVPGGRVSAAYMSIHSTRPLKLVKVETPAAGLVEIHNMNMKDGVMEMKAVDTVDIPANKPIELKPGGLHVMLMKVGKPINTGDKVPLVLTFQGADKKPLVVKLAATAQEKATAPQKR